MINVNRILKFYKFEIGQFIYNNIALYSSPLMKNND